MNENPPAKWRKLIVNPCDSISEILNIHFQMFKEFFYRNIHACIRVNTCLMAMFLRQSKK